MSVPDETLMAYADGELDASERAAVEAAIRNDPNLEQRVARYRDLRSKLQAAYAPVLAEPVPDRLLAALRDPNRARQADVIDLGRARAAAASAQRQRRVPRRAYAASLAASVIIAIGIGALAWQRSQSVLIENFGGSMVAAGALARGLSSQLAGDPASMVHIGLSFRAKSGEYCRTFTLSSASGGAGLACREAERWEVRELTQSSAGSALDAEGASYRTAGSSLPPSILAAVQAQISGEPMDRAAEMKARGEQWRPH